RRRSRRCGWPVGAGENAFVRTAWSTSLGWSLSSFALVPPVLVRHGMVVGVALDAWFVGARPRGLGRLPGLAAVARLLLAVAGAVVRVLGRAAHLTSPVRKPPTGSRSAWFRPATPRCRRPSRRGPWPSSASAAAGGIRHPRRC